MSRISKEYPAATRQSGSFLVNSASSGIKSSLGPGYAFKEQTTLSTGDEKRVPVYSLPAKLPPTVPMPRHHDVINGVAVIQWLPPSKESASSSVDVTDYSQASPAPPLPAYASSASSGISSSSSSPRMAATNGREGMTEAAVSRNKAMADDTQTRNRVSVVSPQPHYGSGTMGSADTDTHGRVNGYNGSSKQTSHYSGAAEDDTSEYYSENSYSEEQDQRTYYRSQHYGTAPADLELLMEAAKWKRDDDVDPRIKSGRGTVRGVTNMVRASIEAFTSPDFFNAKVRTTVVCVYCATTLVQSGVNMLLFYASFYVNVVVYVHELFYLLLWLKKMRLCQFSRVVIKLLVGDHLFSLLIALCVGLRPMSAMV